MIDLLYGRNLELRLFCYLLMISTMVWKLTSLDLAAGILTKDMIF